MKPSTGTGTAAAQSAAQSVETPTVRRVAVRSVFWVLAALFVIVIALVSFAIVGSAAGGVALSATNPAPRGAMALAEVLTRQGVLVTPTSSFLETRRAITDPAATTLFVYDPNEYVTKDRLAEAVGLAQHVILINPTFNQLQAVAREVALAGVVDGLLDGLLDADCEVTAVQKAGSVSGNGYGFRLIDDTADAQLCLTSGDSIYSLIQLERGSSRLTILGTTDALSNEFITNDGNAALALNLLGETDNLVWYLPTLSDLAETPLPTLGELTPRWVNPVLALLAITAIAAAVWRGRRFGPLIVENLPVVVRASETMVGRARLYEKGAARLRALDSLRIGAVDRLARQCGLPRVASIDEVVSAAGALTGMPTIEVRRILVDASPTSDTDLVRLSDDLLKLEHAVTTAVRPD